LSAKRLNKINRRNQAGETPLHRAAAAGKVDEIRQLLEKGAHVNVQCNAGWTPLHKACLKGYTEIVRLLCQNGAKTDIGSNDEHDTPLHDACSNGHQDVVQILLEHGANPRIQNSEGTFPHELVDDDMRELKKIMVDATNTFRETKKESNDEREDSEPPISPAMKRHSRRTSTASDAPFQSAIGSSRPKRGAPAGKDDLLARDILYRDAQRRTHLHLNAMAGNDYFVKELLNMGASHSARDRDGHTPLHLASRGGHKDVVEALLLYGADVNALSKQDETPLHEVAGRGHKDIVNMLLFYGADPTKKNSVGRTALDVAIQAVSTAAEGEIDLLRQKFLEFGGVLPELEEEDNMDVKMEEVDETAPVSDDVDRENTANEFSTSTLPSPTLDTRILPINEVDEKSPEPTILNGNHGEITEELAETQSVEPIAPNDDVAVEMKSEEMQVDDPETQRSPLASSLEDLPLPSEKIESAEEVVHYQQEEAAEVEATVVEESPDQISPEPVEEETVVREPSPPAEPLPKPQWMKLLSLESLPESLEKDISSLLPLYTVQFSGEDKVYVAHTQVCSILGFKTEEFFTKCLFL
jgi:ankyrin repeat protein